MQQTIFSCSSIRHTPINYYFISVNQASSRRQELNDWYVYLSTPIERGEKKKKKKKEVYG